MKNEAMIKKCPFCGRPYFGIGAISRRDNKTEICSECGTGEAMYDWFSYLKKKEEEKNED